MSTSISAKFIMREQGFVPLEAVMFKGYDRTDFNPETSPLPLEVVGDCMERGLELYFSKEFLDHCKQYSRRIAAAFSNEAAAVFGTGYPHYIDSPELPDTLQIAEFYRFYSRLYEQYQAETQNLENNKWVCSGCQKEGNLRSNFKHFCKGCGQTGFRPRDLFKVLPDIDLTFVVPEISERSLRRYATIFEEYGFLVSDAMSLEELLDYPNNPKDYVFGDFHFVEYELFVDHLQQLNSSMELVLNGSGMNAFSRVDMPLASYRGNNIWNFTETLPLDFDALASLTPIAWNQLPPELVKLFGLLSKNKEKSLSIMKTIADIRDRKEARMLDCGNDGPILRSAFLHRVERIAQIK